MKDSLGEVVVCILVLLALVKERVVDVSCVGNRC